MMDGRKLEKAMQDCGLPGRLVLVDKNLITVDLLNDRTERLERVVLGLSEFCDLLLDWRQKLISRTDSGSASLPRLAAEGLAPLEEATAA